jgi:hypothetical protein
LSTQRNQNLKHTGIYRKEISYPGYYSVTFI